MWEGLANVELRVILGAAGVTTLATVALLFIAVPEAQLPLGVFGGCASASLWAAAVVRRRMDRWPLRWLGSPRWLRSEGATWLRARAVLGLGRVMRNVHCRMVVQAPGQPDRVVPVLGAPFDCLVGPVTLVARDPELCLDGEGTLRVDVEGEEAGQPVRLQLAVPFAQLREGQFAAPVRSDGHRMGWDRSAWERLEAPRQEPAA